MTTSSHYPWLARIDEAIASLDEKPLFKGEYPSLLSELEKGLKETFKKDFKLSLASQKWCSFQELQQKTSDKFFLEISLAPLNFPIYLAMSHEDVASLMIELFEGKDEASAFLEKKYVLLFFQYLAVEACQLANTIAPLEGYQLKIKQLSDIKHVLNEPSFEMSTEISLNEKKALCICFFPKSFKEEFNKHASVAKPSFISRSSLQKVPLEISLEVGRMGLTVEEWKTVGSGDFLLLDQCFFDPVEKKGRLILSLNNHPLFRAKVVDEGIKLLDYPLYDEGVENMDFNEDDEDLFKSFLSDHDENSFLEEDEEEEDVEKENAEEFESTHLKRPEPKKISPQVQKETNIAPIGEVPLQMTVEVGRIKLTVEELSALSPGNILEIPVSVDQGVSLVINGKKIGSGELIKIGEMLGVRITSL